MIEHRLGRVLELWNDALRKNFAELHTPLIERINVPNHSLSEDGVLVKRNKLAQCFGVELLRKDRIGGAIAFKDAVRHKQVRSALRFHLLWCLTKCQGFSLSENIGKQHVMMTAQRIERLPKSDEVARNEARALMDQLIERVLAVGARFTPVDGARIFVDCFAIECDMLPVALHGQLLQIGRKPFQILFVRQYSDSVCAEKIVVP